MIEGDYLKFNSNSGHSNGDKLMGALSHFSYHHSQDAKRNTQHMPSSGV